jgi:hypothetical protein
MLSQIEGMALVMVDDFPFLIHHSILPRGTIIETMHIVPRDDFSLICPRRETTKNKSFFWCNFKSQGMVAHLVDKMQEWEINPRQDSSAMHRADFFTVFAHRVCT